MENNYFSRTKSFFEALFAKNVLLLALTLLAALGMEAQTTVSIGAGSPVGASRSTVIPINSNYGYTYSQQVYLASEYNTAGGTGLTSISKLRFYYNGTGSGSAVGSSTTTTTFDNWTIYMGNTSKSSFSSTTDWVPSSALTQVFSGTVTFPAPGNWMEITFATPFLWDGTSNLVVAVDENKDSYGSSVYWGALTSGVTNRGISYQSDSTNPNPASPPTGTRRNNLPYVQFVAQAAAGCQTPAAQPTALAFSSVTGTSLSGSFTVPSPAPTGYMVVRSTSATAPTAPTDGTALTVGSTALGAGTYVVANTATGSFTDSGLTANTSYYYYIYAYNSGCVGTPPVYLTTTPLTGNVVTCMPTPVSSAATGLSTSSFTANWTGAATDAGYELEVSTSSTFTTLLPGFPLAITNNGTGIGSYEVSGLSSATTYYYRVRATGVTCSSAYSATQTVLTSCGFDSVPSVTQTFATYTPVCWSEATGALGSTLTLGSSAWGTVAGMGNTGSNAAAKINLYSTKNDWLISQSINLGAGGNYTANFDMAVTNYNGTTSQTTLSSHSVRVIVSTDNGVTWSPANVVRTYTGTDTYSATGAAQSISLAGYSGIIKIGFLATTTSTSPDIDFHIDNFQVVAAPPVVTSFSPVAACVDSGASVTITGANLSNATGVTVNGTPATITANTNTSLTFTMPNGASTGLVAVTTAEGTGSSATNFTVNAYPVLEDIVGGEVSLCKDGTVQLSNTTSGGVWTSSNTAIATVSSAGLVTAVSEGTAVITYTVTVSGCATAKTTSITVNNPPVITAQANNQIVLDGADASYAITATGTGISYQWQVSTDNGVTWNNIEGATNASYTLVGASSADNGKQFQCVVSGTAPCTAATSNVVTLTVGSVSITAQPTNQIVCSDAGATFTVGTSGEVSSYQWQVSTNGTSWTDLEGANATSLVLNGLTSSNTGTQYRCVLNGGDVISDGASLTVFDAVAIGTQPANQTVCSNAASVTFTSVATGSGLSYQWQMSTNGTDWSNVTGATSAAYTINTPSVSLNNNQYRVVVSGTAPCSAVTSDAATLTVNEIVAITAQPVAVTQCSTESTASFSVTATGTGLGYQWQYATNGTTWNDYVGATSSTLTVDAPATYAGNSFRCVVSGTAPCTSVTSNAVVLNVSQILGGTYTVGTGGNYATITAAVTAYNNAICFSDNVVFNLTDATYSTAETFPIVINQNANIGAYTLTIKPASGVSPTISGTSTAAIIKVNGADNVTIDGSNNGSSSRDLSIVNNSTSGSSVVWIASTGGATSGANNITVKNTKVKGGSGSTSGIYGIVSSTTSSFTTGAENNDNLVIQNNEVTKVYNGITAFNNSTSTQDGLLISGNTVGSTVNADRVIFRGIQVTYVNDPIISSNSIIELVTTASINIAAIDLGAGVVNGSVISNRINNIKNTTTSGYGAYGINFSSATGTTGTLVANNMISNIETANYSATSNTFNAFGIRVGAAIPNLKFYNNTVNMYGNVTSGSSAGMSANFVTTAAATNIDMRNNIFRNVQSFATSGSSAYNVYLTSGTTFTDINYNNYVGATTTSTTYRLGYNGSANVADLASWRTFTTKDLNSVAIAPNFVSNTDLHLVTGTNAALDNIGTPIAAVTTDFDGDTRSATPDMGADEFSTSYCGEPAVAGTVTATPASLCTSGSATVAATGYMNGVGTTYEWESSADAEFTSPVSMGVASAIYADVSTGEITATTYYRLKVTCLTGTPVYSDPIAVVVNTPAITTVSPNVTVCSGDWVELTASGAISYTWSPATGLSATTGAIVRAEPAQTTTYTVTGTDANGCTSTATVTVTINLYPSDITIVQGAPTICTDGVMSLTANGGTVTIPQTPSAYIMNGTSGTYSAITGTTLSSSAIGDDVGVGNLPIGFAFPYNGTTQTVFAASSNGLLLLGNTSATISGFSSNALASTANAIAPLWDDNNTTGGSITYATTGTAPNRVLTVQWTNMHVAGAGSSTNPTISMQAQLFENGNIRFIYGSTSATLSSPTASIGISGASGNYLSVTPLSPIGTSTASSTAENTSVNTANIPNGTIINFVRPVQPSILKSWYPFTDLYTDAAATSPYTGQDVNVVYVKPTTEVTYIVTAFNGDCTSEGTTTVTPLPLPEVVASEGVTICSGDTTTLTVSGANTYVWSPATGLSSTTGNTVDANPTVTTTYTVTGTSADGCQSTDTVTVTVNNPIVITYQTPGQSVLPGVSSTISVTATGSISAYQWMVSTDDGETFEVLEANATYEGVDTNALTINNIDLSYAGLQFQCVISGTTPCADVTSEPYALKVNNVAIQSNPNSVSICESGNTSFTASATSTDETVTITYQWQMNTGSGFVTITNGIDASGLTFDGATTNTLNVSGITLANTGYIFRARVNDFINTTNATLTVNNPVLITASPANQTVCVNGGTASFVATATGDNLSYQWQMSSDNGATWNNVANATAATFTVTNPTLSMNGNQYRVVVNGATNCSSATSDVATLTINNPTITSQPIAATVLRGNTATFSVEATDAISYQWQFSTDGTTGWANVDTLPAGVTYSGADTATLSVITSASTATGGAKYYRCVIDNNGCAVNSSAALLTVNWYCTPAPSSVDGSGIVNVTLGDINNSTGSETGNYGDYTAQSTSSTQLSTVNFSITYATGYTYGTKIWIDFNDNGDFTDAGEQVYFGLSTSANPTTLSGSFNIPLTAPLGAHRMRIGGTDNDAGPSTPCYTGAYGSFEDYTITITPAPTCDSTPVAGTATAGSAYVCSGAATNVAVTGQTSGVLGISLQWYASTNNVDFTPVADATAATLATAALTEGTYFYCTVTCATSGLSANSNTVFVEVYNPAITATTDAARCGTGTVTLGAEANASATINWYAAETGGASLGTGTTFTTPSIATTTTFYAEAFKGGAVENVGNQDTAEWSEANFYTTSSSDAGIVFTTTKPNVTVKKAYVYVTGTGTLTFTLRNAAGTSIATHTENVTNATSGTAVEVSLPSTFSAATAAAGYRLTMTKTGVTWYYFTGSYPYTSSAVNITSGWGWGATTTEVRGIHNIDFEAGCTSARTAVVATVGQKPTASLSYATPFCSSATNGNVTLTGTNEYQNGTFSGSEGLSIDPVTGAIDVMATLPGTYTVTYTMLPTTYCEAQTASTTVVINQELTSNFSYDAAAYCTSATTITPTVTGTAGTFTASPSGLSINATTGAINLATSAAGEYTITNTVSVAGCANSVSTAVVTVNTAVAITSQPGNSSVLPGADVNFAVTATGTGLTYQWQVSTDNGSTWTNIEGATAATLSLTSVSSSAQYQVIVSGATACDTVTSNVATLTVNSAAIAQNPVNFTACSEGANTATFSVTTTGEVTGYQWQVNEGSGWSNITNGGIYADATSATLSLSGLALVNNGWQFRCVVNETVISNPATLTINTAVAITTQPENTTACSNGSATFTAAATGTGIAYQWQMSTNGTDWTNVAGATSATLTLNAITPSMNGNQYQVIVSGTAPCSPVTSNAATLNVNTAVAIATQPVGATVCIDGAATFTVAATGSGLAYQWEMSTNGTSWSPVADATEASLIVSGAQLAMNGSQYRVVVSGATACSSVTSSAVTLVVDQPAAPVFTPAAPIICEGNVQTLSVASSSVAQNGVIGSGSVSNTTSTPFKGYWGGIKVQYLYSASELQALGYTNGTVITSLGMDITSFSSPYTYNNFTVSMKNTASTVLTSTFETGATIVKNTSNYVLSGTAPFTVTLPLDNSFVWDGSSSLLVEFCFNNNNGGGTSSNSANVKSSTTSTNMTTYYSADNTATVCTNTSGTTSTTRTNMRFGVSGGTLVWSPTTDLYTNAAATTPYTGGHASTVYAKPSTTTQYTVTATNSNGCSNVSTVTVTVNPKPTLASVAQAAAVCEGSTATINLTGLIANSTFSFGYKIGTGATVNVPSLTADASGNASFNINVVAANNNQTLTITAIQSAGCTQLLTVNNTTTLNVLQNVTYYVDADGDGFGDATSTVVSCQGAPTGYVSNNTDCNDANPSVNATALFYVDADGDGFGSTAASYLCAATAPAGYASNNTDCDDSDTFVWQSAVLYVDADQDGYDNGSATVCYGASVPAGYATSTSGADCNDALASIHSAVTYYVDADQDGYGSTTTVSLCVATAPEGYAVNNTDCDDTNSQVWQTGSFYVDADADTYGAGQLVSLCYGANTPAGYALNNTDCDDANVLAWQTGSFYADADADTYGVGQLVSLCYGATTPAGYALNNTDCDDANALAWQTGSFYVDADADTYGAGELVSLCYGANTPAGYAVNNTDCNDTKPAVWRSATFYVDADSDGYDNGSATVCYGAETPAGYATTTNGSDCNDSNAAIHTAVMYYVDADGDGYGSTTTAMLCELTAPEGYSLDNTDCDDEDAAVWRSATLYVDGDADGYDNGSATVCYGATTPVGYATTTNGLDCDDTNADVWHTGDFYVDADADTYGTGEAVSLCYGANTPSGYATRAGDCNDSSASVNPGATEICGNSIDDNCNGQTDEGCGTQVQSSQCGVAVASFSTNVLADLVTGATQYRFEVSRGATVYE
ncbi:GEVED domain-containing protein, partial [uncultured Flavobacterium sp.]|uniref:GEVED domain-containing protein n=1 Tax=uncultured Flavobacterium sp. TaxID=165435 RepID=UPI002627A2BB